VNSRECFLACMRCQEADLAPNWEMGYWAGNLERWYQEGLADKAISLIRPAISWGQILHYTAGCSKFCNVR
jgi:hypothetical protein